jgi:sortase A
MDHYRQTGRVVKIASDKEDLSLDRWHAGMQKEDDAVAELRPRKKRFFDAILLVIEISAVLGFIFIIFSGLGLIQELNREVAAVLDEQPTLSPTPLILAAVLPSGHIPPDASGGTRFNEDEIPEHLKPLLQSFANIPVPTPGPEQANRIQIPAIQVDAPIVQGDNWEQLKKGVGQHVGTGIPGESGNVVLSAHNDIFGEIFRDLDQLKPGDEIIVFTNQDSYTYIVGESRIVDPDAVEFLAPSDQPIVTLISCYPYLQDSQRIVITADLK